MFGSTASRVGLSEEKCTEDSKELSMLEHVRPVSFL